MADPAVAGRIGPNAVTRVAEALRTMRGEAAARRVFAAAGLAHRLDRPPEAMVEDAEVAALHAALRDLLGPEAARAVGREAGRLTADYVIAHRIPGPVRWALARLPPPIAARLLLRSVARHAWTFAGAARVACRHGRPIRIAVAGGPVCRGAASDHPACDYYAAAFQRLFRRLASPAALATELACEATGAPACLFELRW